MTARCFADTNVAVYALDADPARRGAALAVMKARPTISVQVVNEDDGPSPGGDADDDPGLGG